MLAPILSTLSKLSINHRQFNCSPNRAQPTLQAVSSYSCFVQNQVFNECRPFEVLTYAAVQYLSFHSIKCSARNIAKNAHLSERVIKNALHMLRKRQFIAKQTDDTYLFRKFNLEGSAELVDAREVVRLHRGYWFPIDILKSKRISNQEKRAFAVILNLIKTGHSRVGMGYISEKMGLKRRALSPLIYRLLDERLITRHRNHCRSVFTYQVGAKAMSIYKKDLSTIHTNNRSNYVPIPAEGNPDCTSKGNPDCTSLSIKESNRFLIDTRKDKSASDTCKSGQNKSISFFEEERKRLNVKYTQACNDKNWELMNEIGSELSTIDVMIKK